MRKKIFYPIPSLCDCGCNEVVWNGNKYINGHNNIGIRFSNERRSNMSKSMKGKKKNFRNGNPSTYPEVKLKVSILRKQQIGCKNHNWRGGISFLPYCYKFNLSLKEKIRKRDNYQCQFPECLCSQLENIILYKDRLHVHHIHYDKHNCNPDLIALCTKHNGMVNSKRDYHEQLFMDILKKRGLLNE